MSAVTAWWPVAGAPVPVPAHAIRHGVIVVQLAADRDGRDLLRVWHVVVRDGVMAQPPTVSPMDAPLWGARSGRRLWVRVVSHGASVAVQALDLAR